ncbi:MAG: DUF4364 family protein [Peptoniphilus sp.]|nr:DUF4364 family protein [Peptoniphilus sp.]MDY3118487.1 DUF4364 family protein [Peptoniphilus sp.]
MKKETLHTLAADKLYLLSSIDAWNGHVPKKEFYDAVLKEGQMNYFFLCQYISELQEVGLLEEMKSHLFLTDEGREILAMFGDSAIPVARAAKKATVSYAIYDDGDFTVYQKRVDDALIFSLALSKKAFPEEPGRESDEARVETLIRCIEKAKPLTN